MIQLPKQERRYRNRRLRRVGHARLREPQLRGQLAEGGEGLTATDYQLLADHRPRVRADCRDNGLRPCPFVGCRYHLWCDVVPVSGELVVNFPDLEPGELEHSCALDLAEEREYTLEEVAVLTNLTREMVRQIEGKALTTARAMGRLKTTDDGAGGERPVRGMANLKIMRGPTGAKAIVVRAGASTGAPVITYTCGSCGKQDSSSFDGYSAREIETLAAFICMQPSLCCGAPVTARIEGLPGRVLARKDERERALRAEIVRVVEGAGEAGMSLRQVRSSVVGSNVTILKLLRRLVGSGELRVREVQTYRRYLPNRAGSGTARTTVQEARNATV